MSVNQRISVWANLVLMTRPDQKAVVFLSLLKRNSGLI